MPDLNQRQLQVVNQYRAVAYLARSLAGLCDDMVKMHKTGQFQDLVEMHGQRSAYQMEVLGDLLNEIDAIEEVGTAFLNPIFEEAHKLWPQR